MDIRTVGWSGLPVSLIGFGCSTLGSISHGADAIALVHHALDRGVTFFDTAVSYTGGRSEVLLGQALRGRRHEVVLATKVGLAPPSEPENVGLSRRRIMSAIETSLARLETDHVDLYQAHRPDPSTPLEETLEAMDRLVREGKVRYVGGSNYSAAQMVEVDELTADGRLARWTSAQNRFNLLDGLDDPPLLATAGQLRLGIIPYMPLASGMLTGKYRPGTPPPPGTRAGDEDPTMLREVTQAKLEAVERLKPWAAARGHTVGELAIAWLLDHAEVATVIPSARSAAQIDENIAAAAWRLAPGERDEVRRVALMGIDNGT